VCDILSISNLQPDVILSMSPTDLKELQGEHLILKQAVKPGSASEASQIRVIDLDGKEYCLPKAQCQTWFVGGRMGFVESWICQMC